MANETPVLAAQPRTPEGSRTARRLRGAGVVPGIVYGGGIDPVSLSVTERDLRIALAGHSALIDLHIEGDKPQPVLVREQQRHPVSGRTVHVDLIRVDLKKKVQASVQIEIIGAEDSPGVRFGGLVEQIIREANIECLPTEIPDSIIIDASQMEIGDSLHVSDLAVPEGAEMVDEGDIVIATMAASRMAAQVERDAEEAETELIGDGEAAEGEDGETADSGEAASSDGDGDGE